MIYLDNSATTFIKPRTVTEAMNRYMQTSGGNPGRGGHFMSMRASDTIYKCRENIAKLLGVDTPEQIVLTPSATFGLNLVIKSVLNHNSHAVITDSEHNSVLRPVHEICDYSVCSSPQDALTKIKPNTKLLVVNHASNVNGRIADLEGYKKVARSMGVYLLLDSSQSAGHIPLCADGIDFIASSGHKGLFGPQGTGFLYVRKGIVLTPLVSGGTGFHSESYTQPLDLPEGLESGTLNGVGFAGLKEGVEYVLSHDNSIEQNLNHALKEGLSAIPKVKLYTPIHEETVPVVAFNIRGTDCVSVSEFLSEKFEICVRSGLHCAPLMHKTLGTIKTGAVRASVSCFNRLWEIEKFLNIIDNKLSFGV